MKWQLDERFCRSECLQIGWESAGILRVWMVFFGWMDGFLTGSYKAGHCMNLVPIYCAPNEEDDDY